MKLHQLTILVIVLFVSTLFMQEFRQLNHHIQGADADEHLIITFNVAKHNFFALNDIDNKNAMYATNQREPLPIFLWAQSLKSFSNIDSIENIDTFLKSKELRKAKYINLVFLLILMVSLILLIFQIPETIVNSFSKVIFCFLLLITIKIYGVFSQVNFFAGDLYASAFICLLFFQCVYFFKKPSKLKLYFAGVIYGLLCLTKATFFYSGIIVFFLAIIYQAKYKFPIKNSILFLIGALVVTSPWIARNYMQTGQTSISGRGPETFVDRTYEEIYNDKHFIGLWYAYSPDFFKPLATELTGYDFQDRLKGGRLQHSTRAHIVDFKARNLNDETMAINSHFKAGIWMTHIYDDIYAKVKSPIIAKKQASKVYQQFALKEMWAHPIRHLKFTMIYIWRGIWVLNSIDGRTSYEMGNGKQEPFLKQILPFLGLISLMTFFVLSLIKKHHKILVLTVFPLAAYGFNGFFSHNLPRYGEQFIPILLLALGVALLYIKHNLMNQFRKN